ncbi:MAG: peptide chain release factor N(5)-glutamine methyltransferase [Synergistes sp.]|nr:peptide chain release factor N(5)-glutamine methyltransferase [Synergistes sp.]
MRLQELRRKCREILSPSHTARQAYSADMIISRRTRFGTADLLWKDDDISQNVCKKIMRLAERRASGVPLSYVLHEAEFCGYRFKVGRGVLIPRPETELLVEEALKYFPAGRSVRFADWCTGSGCIACTLLMENKSSECVAVDKSRHALRWAEINVKFHSLGDRIKLVCCGEPENVIIENESLDFIIANPPYIPSCEIPHLMNEVRNYEPHIALDGGDDGTELYKKFFRTFPYFIKHGGLFLTEIAGDSQAETLISLAVPKFVPVNKIRDYNGIIRHIIWRKN